MSEPQLRETGLRIPAERAALPVRLLGSSELALEPKELPLAVPRKARSGILRLEKALLGSPHLFQRFAPGAIELQDLRAMDEAAARERHHLRLHGPPVRERPRPFARTPHLIHLLTGKDDAAVDDPRHDRRELIRSDRNHAFVEQRETLAHPRVLDQHGTLPVNREREQIAVAKPLSDRNGLACRSRRQGELPSSLVLEHHRKPQVPELSARSLMLEKPLRATKPAGRRADLTPYRKLQADPDPSPGRRPHLARLQVATVGALKPPNRLVVAPQHERARRERIEVIRDKTLIAIERRKRLVRRGPCPLRKSLSASLKFVDPISHATRPPQWTLLAEARSTRSRRHLMQTSWGATFVVVPNPAHAGKAPTPLVAVCHDGSPCLSMMPGCGHEAHLHESQLAGVAADVVLVVRCPICRQADELPVAQVRSAVTVCHTGRLVTFLSRRAGRFPGIPLF